MSDVEQPQAFVALGHSAERVFQSELGPELGPEQVVEIRALVVELRRIVNIAIQQGTDKEEDEGRR